MYELSDMSMKFERRLDSEAVDFLFLSPDYGKLVILESDRNIEFQAPYGTHYKLRIPTFGRALGYEESTCDLHVTSASGDVYRINLEEGRFVEVRFLTRRNEGDDPNGVWRWLFHEEGCRLKRYTGGKKRCGDDQSTKRNPFSRPSRIYPQGKKVSHHPLPLTRPFTPMARFARRHPSPSLPPPPPHQNTLEPLAFPTPQRTE
jgi:hypothetical protein